MLKTSVISFSIILAFAWGARCQYYTGGLTASTNIPKTDYNVDSAGNIRFKPGDIGFTMQVGTGIASNFKGNSSFSTYISPALAYNVSSRFRIKAGVSVFNNFGDPYYTGYESYFYPVLNSGTTTSLFIQGDYILCNKLMVSGAVYKDFSTMNAITTDQKYKVPDSQGMILNLNYRPTRNFEINASFEYGNGNRSLLHSPFYSGGLMPGYSPW